MEARTDMADKVFDKSADGFVWGKELGGPNPTQERKY